MLPAPAGSGSLVYALSGLYSAQSTINRHSSRIDEPDVDAAIKRALEKSQESIQDGYLKAIYSKRSDSLYRHVLLACALAIPDERGQFTPQSIGAPLSSIFRTKCENRYILAAFKEVYRRG
jgi:hypothetical protein